jgi:hypothetical protein
VRYVRGTIDSLAARRGRRQKFLAGPGSRMEHAPAASLVLAETRVKDLVRKIIDRLRQRPGGAATAPSAAGTRPPDETPSLLPVEADEKSGLTVFDDRPLRFRGLTLATESGAPVASDGPESIPGAFKIRVAKRQGFQRAAGALVERRYSDRGYRTQAHAQDPNLFTFVAYDEGRLVGTVGIRVDSAPGLNADALYKDELAVLRNAGCKLCEFTRLAVDAAISRPVLAGLFHTAYLYAGAVHGCTYMVIEVTPRHVPFYRRALGFEPIGAEHLNPRVNTRGVLLCVSFQSVADNLKRFGGRRHEFPHERSLFPYGFSPEEEAGILQRLKALDAEQHALRP